MNTFTQSKDAFLILDGYMLALMHDINSFFYLCDPHARNYFGMSDSNGTDVVFEFGKSIYSQLFIDAVQSDLRMCTKKTSFYYTNSLFRFLFYFMVLQSLIVVS
jgi:hypothetical protein